MAVQRDCFAVISDLHLGERGPKQTALLPIRWVLDRLCQFLADASVKKLIINGDGLGLLKGAGDCIRDAKAVLAELRQVITDVLLVPGNHDIHLQTLRGDPLIADDAPGARVLSDLGITLCPETLTIGRASLFHGHLADSALTTGRRLDSAYRELFAAVAASAYATSQYSFSAEIKRACQQVLGFRPDGSRSVPTDDQRLQALTQQCVMDAVPEGNIVLVGHTHVEHHGVQHAGRTFWNTGCWVLNPQRLDSAGADRGAWPGGIALVRETGEVTMTNLLRDLRPGRLLDLAGV
jgi:UDP-2,3-diacylglucosamine pyrophosphatase LpxH